MGGPVPRTGGFYDHQKDGGRRGGRRGGSGGIFEDVMVELMANQIAGINGNTGGKSAAKNPPLSAMKLGTFLHGIYAVVGSSYCRERPPLKAYDGSEMRGLLPRKIQPGVGFEPTAGSSLQAKIRGIPPARGARYHSDTRARFVPCSAGFVANRL